MIGAKLAVERKGPHDLGSSIRGGRIFDQAVRLQSALTQAVLLIEGEPPGIAEDGDRAACSAIRRAGTQLIDGLTGEMFAAGSDEGSA